MKHSPSFKTKKMKATIGYYYSELDNEFQYYCDSLNNWVWFGLGEMLLPEIILCPYLPTWHDVKIYEITETDYHKLGNKCAKKLNKLCIRNKVKKQLKGGNQNEIHSI
jgi:hypothetical protein